MCLSAFIPVSVPVMHPPTERGRYLPVSSVKPPPCLAEADAASGADGPKRRSVTFSRTGKQKVGPLRPAANMINEDSAGPSVCSV